VTDTEVYFFWPETGTFVFRKGSEIVVDALPHADVRLISLFLTGTGLGVLLQQRGLLLLHASAVMINKCVVAFLGGSGWGKSTMAGALRMKGYTIVSDDILAIDFPKEQKPLVRSGITRMKLWPESLECLGEDPRKWQEFYPGSEKRSISLDDTLQQTAILGRIYVLAEGASNEITRLPPQAAFLQIIRHLYLACLHGIFEGKAFSRHLQQATSVSASVPICLLRRRLCLATLSQVVDLVEKDIAVTG
jgi:hypothetical protein